MVSVGASCNCSMLNNFAWIVFFKAPFYFHLPTATAILYIDIRGYTHLLYTGTAIFQIFKN